MRNYLTADVEFSSLVLHDTLAEMVVQGSDALEEKGRVLKWAFVALALTGAILGVGVVHDGLRGDDGGGQASSQSTPASTTPATP